MRDDYAQDLEDINERDEDPISSRQLPNEIWPSSISIDEGVSVASQQLLDRDERKVTIPVDPTIRVRHS